MTMILSFFYVFSKAETFVFFFLNFFPNHRVDFREERIPFLFKLHMRDVERVGFINCLRKYLSPAYDK